MPSKFPSLLINGSAGIAVGMATNIPPHNLREVIDALHALIDNPEMTWADLARFIPGPDFPTGGIIYGTRGIYDAYETGRGVIRVRAKIEIEEDKKNQSETIVVTELPYQVNKAKLVEAIADMIKHKQIEGIRYVRDESDRRGMRMVVALKKDVPGIVIANQLYKHTRLAVSFGIILLAVVNQRPQMLSLKEVLTYFIRHRKEIVVRRTRFDLKKARARAHILEGLKIALDNLDEVVSLIRQSPSPGEAKTRLMARFALSDIQAQAILEMRLQRLTGLERDKIIEEYENILKDIARYEEILGSERLVLNIIKEELAFIKETFGDARRTEIVEATQEITREDMIAEEDMVVTISQTGYIKRAPLTLYQSQRRGGKGKTAMGTKDEDFVKHLFVASTHHTFLFFTNRGKVYWCKVYDIPQAGRASRGKAVVNLLELSEGEHLTTVLAVPEFEAGFHVMMATRQGIVKKTDLMAFSRPRTGGIIALDLLPGDELIAARITNGTMNVFLSAAQGKSIRFHEADIRPSGRGARGVRGMRLEADDRIVGMEVLSHGQTLMAITENGYGKRTSIDEYPVHKRGGKGVITIKTNERNGRVVDTLLVEEEDELMLITNGGMIIRMLVQGISVISRNTQGVRLMDLAPSERVISTARVEGGQLGSEEAGDASDEDEMEDMGAGTDGTDTLDRDLDDDELPDDEGEETT
jgi:DNA gyrase subunit A